MTIFLYSVVILGLFVCIFGMINIVFPMRSLGVRTRGRAFWVALLGIALFFTFSSLARYSLSPEERAKVDADAATRAAAREQRKQEKASSNEVEKVYSSGTLLAFAEGNAGWVGVGGRRGAIIGGVALPAYVRQHRGFGLWLAV